MKQFTITYVTQQFFGHGFIRRTQKVWGAINTHRALKSIRGMKNPALAVWVTCE